MTKGKKSNCSHYGDQNCNYNCRHHGHSENALFHHRLKGRSGNLLMMNKNGHPFRKLYKRKGTYKNNSLLQRMSHGNEKEIYKNWLNLKGDGNVEEDKNFFIDSNDKRGENCRGGKHHEKYRTSNIEHFEYEQVKDNKEKCLFYYTELLIN
ncbi:hypothetical protein POWCR01_140062300 [Plasmodium ovale]|uniref:Uncharacterized protein n=1 Tax=Plasmodium ovale TaxID=36330 RepID=A0A1C3L603_PLAOA|nr:hypothetical protein POWCR01_140062300 [Plasmodium ovale]